MQLKQNLETSLPRSENTLTNFRSCKDIQAYTSGKSVFAIRPNNSEKVECLNSPHRKPIRKLIISSISKLMVTVSDSDLIVIWSVESLQVLKKFFLPKKSDSKILSLNWTNFNAALILFFDDKILKIENICHLGENFSEYDETKITLEEIPLSGFKIFSGVYSKNLKDLLLTDTKNQIRLFNLKKKKSVLKLRKICKFRKIFVFEDSEFAFLTSSSNSILVRKIYFIK